MKSFLLFLLLPLQSYEILASLFYVSSHFALLLKNNGLPHIRFHELRHSCASLLLNSGFTLKDVQEYMGHSDIQMTANIYGHLDVQREQISDRKMAASIF